MAETQLISWRELPSLVTAREGGEVLKVPLPPRFQEAIDEAATRLGETAAETYLDGWTRGAWTPAPGAPADAAHALATALDEQWDSAAVDAYLDGLGAGGP
jgi:hypothetical protein